MKIPHPTVRSDVFQLVATYEFDLQINDHFHPTRIELFQDTENARRWRARLWDLELCRLEASPLEQPAIQPARGNLANPPRELFDEEIPLERTWMLGDDLSDFAAEDQKAALQRVLDALGEHLGSSSPDA